MQGLLSRGMLKMFLSYSIELGSNVDIAAVGKIVVGLGRKEIVHI